MINKKRKNRRKIELIAYLCIFLIGLIIIAYPYMSMLYYRLDSKKVISIFEQEKNSLSSQNIDERLKLAQAFNASLVKNSVKDPYTDTDKKQGRSTYAKMLEVNEFLGYVSIPKINEYIPLYAGTSASVLRKGLGHLEGTSLPIGTKSSHTAIAGHTGYSRAKLLTDLNKLKIGDMFYIQNIFEELAYQVDQIKIVEPSEYEDLLITEGMDYATLITCTPYGVNSHRLLVRGKRVVFKPEIKQKQIELAKQDNVSEVLFYICLIISLIFILLATYYYFKRVKLKNRLDRKLYETK